METVADYLSDWRVSYCCGAYLVGYVIYLSPLWFSLLSFHREEYDRPDYLLCFSFWVLSPVSVPFVVVVFLWFGLVVDPRERRLERERWQSEAAVDQWIARMEADESTADWNRIAIDRGSQTVDSTVTPEARALAQAVLQGDRAAVMALTDWCLEQLKEPIGRHSVFYLTRCEDVLREIKGLLTRQPQQLDDNGEAYITLSRDEVNRVYREIFGLELLANGNGRNGPA